MLKPFDPEDFKKGGEIQGAADADGKIGKDAGAFRDKLDKFLIRAGFDLQLEGRGGQGVHVLAQHGIDAFVALLVDARIQVHFKAHGLLTVATAVYVLGFAVRTPEGPELDAARASNRDCPNRRRVEVDEVTVGDGNARGHGALAGARHSLACGDQ